MIRYAFTGRSKTGQKVSGVIEAANEAEARSQIRERGYTPLHQRSQGKDLLVPEEDSTQSQTLGPLLPPVCHYAGDRFEFSGCPGTPGTAAGRTGLARVLQDVRLKWPAAWLYWALTNIAMFSPMFLSTWWKRAKCPVPRPRC